jgi:hypothetical protein
VPRIAIGRIGRLHSSASSNAPVLKLRMRPSGERVPSGNIMIDEPDASVSRQAFIICTTLARSPRRSFT